MAIVTKITAHPLKSGLAVEAQDFGMSLSLTHVPSVLPGNGYVSVTNDSARAGLGLLFS